MIYRVQMAGGEMLARITFVAAVAWASAALADDKGICFHGPDAGARMQACSAMLERNPNDALAYHQRLIREVVRMLCAGVVHGDLSEFNILIDSDGPVIIDLPQAVDAAGNNHAPAILERDVVNLRNYFGRYAPELLLTDYGKEIWALYEAGALQADTPLTGRFERIEKPVDLDGVMQEIDDARFEEAARRMRFADVA